MLYELNMLVGKIFLVGVLLVASVYSLYQLNMWGESYRNFSRDAQSRFGEIEPIGHNVPSIEEAMLNDENAFNGIRRYQEETLNWRSGGTGHAEDFEQ